MEVAERRSKTFTPNRINGRVFNPARGFSLWRNENEKRGAGKKKKEKRNEKEKIRRIKKIYKAKREES